MRQTPQSGGAAEAASQLPCVDEHATELDATPAVVWPVLLRTAEKRAAGRLASRYARAVGCADAEAGGPRPLEVGSTLPGFHVADLRPERLLVLRGSHRFSDYALTFRLEPLGGVRTRLVAETRAEFPGAGGRVYRALVIGTRLHLLAVRQLLGAIARRVDRARRVGPAAAPPPDGSSR